MAAFFVFVFLLITVAIVSCIVATLVIVCLNTLFGLGIPVGFASIVSVIFLLSVFGLKINFNREKSS